ncbi:MAG: NAD(P)H-dependent glycerol-3-phosphate dehydrogenase [Lachnospiraceae bacterium]|nr:NAD(P)H-dependent glycerol-3-phosphate dehydrogenase [Lachnospiraceae bacterium]
MARVSIIGAGTWALGIALLLHRNGAEVTMWSALEDELQMIREKHEHKNLPGVTIPEEIILESDLESAVESAEVLVMAVASIYTRQTAAKMAPYVKNGQIIVDVAKGIEEKTLMTLSEQIQEEIPQANVAVLSGPSHAEEVSRQIPTTCVVGAFDQKTAEFLQNLFMSEEFRVYTSPDIRGIELGGALKNVIALAAGVADGLGYGDNSKAALITRGMAEIARLGVAMGAHPETLYGLSGIGDLIVTCASVHSRNRKAGVLIGQGKTMAEAMAEVKMVVEGVYSAKAAKALADKYYIHMPIVEEINKVLFEGKPASEAVRDLMLRDKRIESPVLPWPRA